MHVARQGHGSSALKASGLHAQLQATLDSIYIDTGDSAMLLACAKWRYVLHEATQNPTVQLASKLSYALGMPSHLLRMRPGCAARCRPVNAHSSGGAIVCKLGLSTTAPQSSWEVVGPRDQAGTRHSIASIADQRKVERYSLHPKSYFVRSQAVCRSLALAAFVVT
eukprot:355150-Chlamydomonas_euryale.AAC.1